MPAPQRDEHHLVPKSRGGRTTTVLHLCHRQVHASFSEAELANQYATVDALLANEDVARFVAWVRTKPNGFYERTKRSGRKA